MNGSITAQAQTISLKPGETHVFSVVFNGLAPCKLRYELTGYNTGTITQDGLYTAPERDGSCEIRILCAEYPDISTYAYVDVRK